MSYDLLIDLHKDADRQGPGGDEQTRLALRLADLADQTEKFSVADIGCGTGPSTMVLAADLNAHITAVDLFPDFLSALETRAARQGLSEKISTLACSMDDLPFAGSSLDIIWTEGSIYNLGFAKGIDYLKQFIKPGGILAVSEITWLTQERPDQLTAHWDSEYPEIGTAAEKIGILEKNGFIVQGYFPLSESCWLDNYYVPMENRFDDFLARHDSEDARSIVAAERHEIELFRQYHSYFSYGFYVAQKAQ